MREQSRIIFTVCAALLVGVSVVYVPAPAVVAGTFALLVLMTAAVWRNSSPLLWLPWFLIPEVRRIVGALGAHAEVSALSVVPFAFTWVAALSMWGRFRDGPRRAHGIAALVGAALIAGIPAGIFDPLALAFALVAYGALVAALMLGAATGPDGERALGRLLTYVIPVISAVAVAQWAGALLPWDRVWHDTVATSTLVSIQIAGSDAIRVFGTLNSPGTLAAVLVMCIPLLLGLPGRMSRFAAAFAILALLLTQVRAAWVAAAFALFIYLLLSRRGSMKAPIGLVVCALGVAVAANLDPTGSLLSRIETFSSLGSDVSVLARLGALPELADTIAANPLGLGLGGAGLAAVRLADEPRIGVVDNGYAALLLQLGPIGFLLFFSAVSLAIGRATQLAIRKRDSYSRGRVGALAGVLVLLVAGDAMYGVTGILFWFLAGVSEADWVRIAMTGDARSVDGPEAGAKWNKGSPQST